MSFLGLKLILTPLFITVITLASRRWGPTVGGLLIGLPLTSGPVSLFLALEQGQVFAAHAALGALRGLICFAVFCVAYARIAKMASVLGSLVVALSTYFAAAWILTLVPTSRGITIVLVLGCLWVSTIIIGEPGFTSYRMNVLWWDLPLRILLATGMVLLITSTANALGPTWSGLISLFPVFACVMTVFAHIQGGSEAVQRLLYGAMSGAFAGASFFLVVALAIQHLNYLFVYLFATLAALSVNGAVLAVKVKKGYVS